MKTKAILLLTFALNITLFTACDDGDRRSISFDDSEVRYNRSVTRITANRLGTYLQDNGIFEKGNRQEVMLEKHDYEYEISWQVEEDFKLEPEALTYYHELQDSLKKYVFSGSDIDMELYPERNRYERWRLSDELRPYVKGEKHIVYYEKDFDPGVVQNFLSVLEEQSFLNPAGEIFLLEEKRNKWYLGLASGNKKSNEFKKQFSELRAKFVQAYSDQDQSIIFEVRGNFLREIRETISAPFFPKSTSANGIKIKYDASVTTDDVRTLRDYIRYKRMRDPDWIAFVRTNDKGARRYKLIMPVESLNNSSEINDAKNFAKAMSQQLLGSYVDLELHEERSGKTLLIQSERM